MDRFLLLIFLADGLIFLRSGLSKWLVGNFPDSLAETLTKFASRNPFSWYKEVLETVAIPGAVAAGWVIQTAESLIGVVVILVCGRLILGKNVGKWEAVFLVAAFLIGAGLNLSFWLASGWMGSAGDNLNLLMLAIELVGTVRVARFLL